MDFAVSEEGGLGLWRDVDSWGIGFKIYELGLRVQDTWA